MGDPRNTDPSVMGEDAGVGNTNIVWHAGKLMALEEAHEPFEVDPKTLATKGGYQSTGGRFTAHPKIDPETGELIWFAYSAGPMPLNSQVDFGISDAAGNVVRRERFEAPYCSMIHDFLVTRNHALIPVLPLTGDLQRAMSGGVPFAWDPSKGAHLAVIRRDEGVSSLRWFEAPVAYVFHPMNAWEEGGLIHCDVFEYPHAPLFPALDGSELPRAPAVLVRWTIDLAGDTAVVRRTQIDDLPGEFPRLDERRACLSYRHGYFAAYRNGNEIAGFDSVAHIDLQTGAKSVLTFDEGDVAGEPVFVPRSADAAEGDGWLLSVVYRGQSDTSDMVILDAGDVAAGPVATAHVPRRVPFGFHGNWIGA
jgi:carotenoid cleavage dioxygenase